MTGRDLKDAQGEAITLADGKVYHLIVDMNAICAMEDRYGSIESAVDVLGNIGAEERGKDGKAKPKKCMKDIRFMLWVALQHNNDDLTEREAGKLITASNVNEVIDMLGRAMSASMPETDEKNVKSPQET